MPVYLDEIKFTNPVTSGNVDWLLANVGDTVLIEHTISIKTYTISSTNTPFIINNTDGYITPNWLTGGDFSQFNVGDDILAYNYITSTPVGGGTGFATILEKLSNTEIRLNNNLGQANNETTTEVVVSLRRITTALNYQWNFIENGEATNYFSKVDGSMQLATITSLNPSGLGVNLPMTFIGAKPYQIGSVTVDEVSLTTAPIYASVFKIKHLTRVTPFMLAEQYDDIVNRVAPEYFFNLNCLKSVFYFEARYDLTNPNEIQTLEKDTILGNSGWFDENFNTKLTNYTYSDLEYKNNGVVFEAPQLNDQNTFKFTIKNTVNSPFVDGFSKVVLNFGKAPNDASEYSGNNRDMLHNFVWDTVTLTVNSSPSPVNGDNYADLAIRSFENVTATFVSATEILIEGSLAFRAESVAVFNESDEPRFMLWASVQNHTLAASVSDRVSLLIDAQAFFFPTVFEDLISFDTKILYHTLDDYLDTPASIIHFTEDDLVGYSQITVNEDRLFDGNVIQLTRLTGRIKMVNVDNTDIKFGKEFTLDQFSFNVANAEYQGELQYFNLESARPQREPSKSIFKNALTLFNTDLGLYEFALPYLNRWEYWLKLNGVDSDFFDTAQPNNGNNHDWRHYNTNKWRIEYETEVSLRYNGVPATYKDSVQYFLFDRNLSLPYINGDIKQYDPDTLADLGTYILGYKNTLVKATFNRTVFEFVPGTCNVVIGIEVKELTDYSGKRIMSSFRISDSDTWFIPLAGYDRVKVELINTGIFPVIELGRVEASCLIDFSKLDLTKLDYKLSARLYEV